MLFRSNEREGAYDIPSWALARHFAHVRPVLRRHGGIDFEMARVVNAECCKCHELYSRCCKAEEAKMLLHGQGQCNQCYFKEQDACNMEDEPCSTE